MQYHERDHRQCLCIGEEMELTEAVDAIFNQIQDHINELHVQVRQLSMCENRNESYEEAYAYYYEVGAHVKEGSNVFKELTKVMKRPKELPENWEKEIFKPGDMA